MNSGVEIKLSFKFDKSVASDDTMFIVSARERYGDTYGVTFLLHNGRLSFDWGSGERKKIDKSISTSAVYDVSIRDAVCTVYKDNVLFGTLTSSKTSIYDRKFLLGTSWNLDNNSDVDTRMFKGEMYQFDVVEHHTGHSYQYMPMSESCMCRRSNQSGNREEYCLIGI